MNLERAGFEHYLLVTKDQAGCDGVKASLPLSPSSFARPIAPPCRPLPRQPSFSTILPPLPLPLSPSALFPADALPQGRVRMDVVQPGPPQRARVGSALRLGVLAVAYALEGAALLLALQSSQNTRNPSHLRHITPPSFPHNPSQLSSVARPPYPPPFPHPLGAPLSPASRPSAIWWGWG